MSRERTTFFQQVSSFPSSSQPGHDQPLPDQASRESAVLHEEAAVQQSVEADEAGASDGASQLNSQCSTDLSGDCDDEARCRTRSQVGSRSPDIEDCDGDELAEPSEEQA